MLLLALAVWLIIAVLFGVILADAIRNNTDHRWRHHE